MFCSTHFWGIKQKGLKYFEHFLPPKMEVDPKAGLMLKIIRSGVDPILARIIEVAPVVTQLGGAVGP